MAFKEASSVRWATTLADSSRVQPQSASKSTPAVTLIEPSTDIDAPLEQFTALAMALPTLLAFLAALPDRAVGSSSSWLTATEPTGTASIRAAGTVVTFRPCTPVTRPSKPFGVALVTPTATKSPRSGVDTPGRSVSTPSSKPEMPDPLRTSVFLRMPTPKATSSLRSFPALMENRYFVRSTKNRVDPTTWFLTIKV